MSVRPEDVPGILGGELSMYPVRMTTLLERLLAEFPGEPVGFEELTVSTAVRELVSVPDVARSATVQAQGGAVRMVISSRQPTSAIGHRIADGETIHLTGQESMRGALFVRQDAVDVDLAVHYWA
jgi:hypothetical protein